nr:aconitase X catalytic domain-containing protein [Chloroflexota bacterium]
MQLTEEEQAMLAGAQGPAVQKAMQIVVTLAEIYDAQGLVHVASAQVAGVSYKNLGDAGVEFLEEWAAQGARVRVPTFMNPAGMDLERWTEMGIPPEFARQQQRVIKALTTMGVAPTCTCTPYLVGYAPRAGDHLAWSESSAVSFANSVLAARSNREGGPSALAAAITGRTAAYGLHLSENRQATHIVEVRCPLYSEADYGALGYLVGLLVGDGVPYFRFLAETWKKAGFLPQQEHLMALGAAMAASGAVALYHIEGVTPEAQHAMPLHKKLPLIPIEDLADGYEALNSSLDEIDFVSLGCPHSTLADIEKVAAFLGGEHVKATLWITTSRAVRELAEQKGLVAAIEAAGGRVFSDTCLVVAPIEELRFKAMATNSAKAAFYSPMHSKLPRRFGSLEQCLQAALTGRWEVSR